MTVRELINILDCEDINQIEVDDASETKDKRYVVIS